MKHLLVGFGFPEILILIRRGHKPVPGNVSGF